MDLYSLLVSIVGLPANDSQSYLLYLMANLLAIMLIFLFFAFFKMFGDFLKNA